VSKGESAPVKAKTTPSAGKVMATVFWDSKGVIVVDYLQKGMTITGKYYVALLDRLDEAIRIKRPGLQKKKVLFHHDNAPAHRSAVARAKLRELRYKLVAHPPYSPDLVPCDFFLFPKLKKELSEKKICSEVMDAADRFFYEQEVPFFSNGMKALEHRWEKCVSLFGNYVEK